jgi:hypothetical protein
MSEMVERVADAINAMLPYEYTHENLQVAARAAIEAMREPPKRMIRTVAANLDLFELDIERVWDPMIDAALATEPVA